MITKPIRFIQIAATTDHIFGLDEAGEVYYRAKPPHDYGTSTVTSYHGSPSYQKKDDAEEKKTWKKCYMYAKVELPKGGAEREAQSPSDVEDTDPALEGIVDEPARKIYKDIETVKKVQGILQEKGIYKDTYKLDGDLGHLTVTAIKNYQKSVNLKETGEIDLALWNSLGLNASNENETIVELTDEVENTDEIFCGA